MTEIDLNLLHVFDTMMELRSVNRAADKLHLTPSAVSHALRRLREVMEDPLFVGAQAVCVQPPEPLRSRLGYTKG